MEMRYDRITASRIHKVAHCKTKRGTIVEPIIEAAKLIGTKAMARGRFQESEVIEELSAPGEDPDALGLHFVVEFNIPSTLKAKSRYVDSNSKLLFNSNTIANVHE